MNRTQREQAVYAAAREGLRRRLVEDKRQPARVAENWLRAWEMDAARQGLNVGPDYWRQGAVWILAELARGKRPPS